MYDEKIYQVLKAIDKSYLNNDSQYFSDLTQNPEPLGMDKRELGIVIDYLIRSNFVDGLDLFPPNISGIKNVKIRYQPILTVEGKQFLNQIEK